MLVQLMFRKLIKKFYIIAWFGAWAHICQMIVKINILNLHKGFFLIQNFLKYIIYKIVPNT